MTSLWAATEDVALALAALAAHALAVPALLIVWCVALVRAVLPLGQRVPPSVAQPRVIAITGARSVCNLRTLCKRASLTSLSLSVHVCIVTCHARSNGIGEALAYAYARPGVTLILIARRRGARPPHSPLLPYAHTTDLHGRAPCARTEAPTPSSAQRLRMHTGTVLILATVLLSGATHTHTHTHTHWL
jgi:hypothetical protein